MNVTHGSDFQNPKNMSMCIILFVQSTELLNATNTQLNRYNKHVGTA